MKSSTARPDSLTRFTVVTHCSLSLSLSITNEPTKEALRSTLLIVVLTALDFLLLNATNYKRLTLTKLMKQAMTG